MARPAGWDILGLDGDPTPGVVESVQALAKKFGDFAHDVEAAYGSLNSFGSDATALEWVGQTAEAFKGQFGPLPGRLQKLYISYSEASDALSAYAPKLLDAQNKADSALRQAQDANVDLQRATSSANNAAADLKTAQQNHATNPNPQTVTEAQTAHDTAQTNLKNAQARMDALKAQAQKAYDDRIAAAKDCAKALSHAQHDGIHNKHWWQHVGETLSEWGGKIAEIAGEIAPVLDVLALATSWIPGVDVVTASLAEADNLIALGGTGLKIAGDTMQGHYGDALMGAGMLGAGFLGGKALGAVGGKVLGKLGREAEDGAEDTANAEARAGEHGGGNDEPATGDSNEENSAEEDAPSPIPRTEEGGYDLSGGQNPVDIVPPDASVRVLKPDPNGGAQEGLEYKWTEPTGEVDADGKTVLDENGDPASITYRLRVHSEDGTAPEGSNAYNGPTYRLQRGARYQDQSGNFYHKNVHNDKSPFFDPDAANKTHIPWPSEYPLPWKK